MEGSLYQRLGGSEAVVAVIDDFVGRCAADSRINQKFAPDRRAATQEDARGSGDSGDRADRRRTPAGAMAETHEGMGVTAGEFDALVERPRRDARPVQCPSRRAAGTARHPRAPCAAISSRSRHRRPGPRSPESYQNAPALAHA